MLEVGYLKENQSRKQESVPGGRVPNELPDQLLTRPILKGYIEGREVFMAVFEYYWHYSSGAQSKRSRRNQRSPEEVDEFLHRSHGHVRYVGRRGGPSPRVCWAQVGVRHTASTMWRTVCRLLLLNDSARVKKVKAAFKCLFIAVYTVHRCI